MLALASPTLASEVKAQHPRRGGGIALDRLDPTPPGDTFAAVPSPEVLGHLRPLAGATLVFAHSPLVYYPPDDGEVLRIVDHQLALHAQLGMQLFHRLTLAVDVPMWLSQGGDDRDNPFGLPRPTQSSLGDLRLDMRVEVLRQHGHAPSAAIDFRTWLPTGDAAAYTGTGTARYAPSLVVGADHGFLAWSTWLSRRFQPAPEGGNLLGGEVLFGAAIGPRVGPVRLSAEVFGSTATDRGQRAFSGSTTALQALFGASLADGPVLARLAAGPGLTRGIGTPSFRVLAMVGFAPDAESHDAREARLAAEAARRAARDAPSRPQPHDDEPPAEADRDGDGLADGADACPDAPGPRDGARPGCPPDRDGDGVADAEDACPDVPGLVSDDPKRHGCPGDRDGDGIVDPEDACPDERGEPSAKDDENGCPTSVRVVGDQIVILERVEFATGSDVLEPVSFGLLDQVARVLRDHPEIVRLGVDGHTDSVGRRDKNLDLSRRRAMSVVRWLSDHGIDARRLEARGYGPKQPIADNATPEGRTKNRRVEFQILRRSPAGEAGWIDGSLE